MFYSHTFLARKGPLGTVWCAAHLQHKLKKSHYTSTDIPSTVERIIFPEVPIALRMYGHLLLGVVRIYSKKVEYLHHDCNDLWASLNTAFRHIDVNLPENATHAQIDAVTFPETYALDAVEIDDDFTNVNESQDSHLRSEEEITLKDQYHAEQELYVRITLEDDIIPDSFQLEQWEESGPTQSDTSTEVHTAPVTEGLNQNEELHGSSGGESLPPFEVMRDHQDNTAHLSSPILKPHIENVDPIMVDSTPKDTTEKKTDTLRSIHALTPVDTHQSPKHGGPSSPPTEARMASDSTVNVSPNELELIPTPPPENPQPQLRKRKRKQYFDTSLILTNEHLKNAINNCSDLVKKNKTMPCSALELWRFGVKKKMFEEVFSEPLISGMCGELENLHRKDLISSNMGVLQRQAAQSVSGAAGSHEPVFDVGEETERIRSADLDFGHNSVQFFPSSPPLESHSHRTAETSPSLRIPSPVSEPRFGTTDTRSDMGMSTHMDMETPNLNFEGRDDDFGAALSDIPDGRNSMESDQPELSFLEQDDSKSPPDSQGAHTVDTIYMSARTRAVAKYLKDYSPLSKFSDAPEDVNLSTILEGKRRKLCARMFYETLVLKNYGVIDVKQDKPYGNIMLKLRPTFSTTKF